MRKLPDHIGAPKVSYGGHDYALKWSGSGVRVSTPHGQKTVSADRISRLIAHHPLAKIIHNETQAVWPYV